MQFDTVLIAPRRAYCVEHGLWPERTINDDLDACIAEHADKLALTALQVESGAIRRFTYREFGRMVDRIAVGLSRLGVVRNDVVSLQLPNWWQFTLTYYACARIGAAFNPLMPIFRERELSLMLERCGAKVVIVPKVFRKFDHEQMLEQLRPKLSQLEHVVVVGGSGANSFEALLSGPQWESESDARAILTCSRPDPDDVTQLMFTSGTTGEPKGVMHTFNTMLSNLGPYIERMRLTSDDVVLMASPLAHQTGFMYGLMMPVVMRGSALLQDVWEPKRAIELIRAECCTYTVASTPFLSDLTKTVAETGSGVPSLRTFQCAGAPIPGALVEQAREVLGAKIVSAFGMTEVGMVTMINVDDDDRFAATTDGYPLLGVEVKVVEEGGRTLPPGEEGKLLIRGCCNFGGYLHRPQLNDTDAQGWFNTGDLARIDERGYIRISGRSKDVIIRGGENIPVVEIEALLYRHPAITKVAIVAYPDERLGERACAVLTLAPGESLDLSAMVQFLKAQKVALQYVPERLLVLDAMPTTPSGKIQKFRLREMVRAAAT